MQEYSPFCAVSFPSTRIPTFDSLVQNARRKWTVVNAYVMCLGTPKEVANYLTDPDVNAAGLEHPPYPFGTKSVLLAADDEFGFSRAIQELMDSGATALRFLAFISGRPGTRIEERDDEVDEPFAVLVRLGSPQPLHPLLPQAHGLADRRGC